MKHFLQIVFTSSWLLFAACGAAHKSAHKPFLFKEYPAVINCTEGQLASLFTAGNNIEISFPLEGNLVLEGEVKWWARKYAGLQTVSIRLLSFNNILFSVTRRYDAADNFVYSGQLYNPDYADGYELKRVSGNQYRFVKVDTDRIMQLCSR